MTKKKLRVGTIHSPILEAATQSRFRFPDEETAKARLETIKDQFILSKEQPEDGSLRLWIRGFALTKDEKKQGYRGNFAVIDVAKLADEESKWTLKATKEPVELKLHPQKERPKQKHPDWGHPVLRRIKKNELFETLEEAEGLLTQLHEDFPEVTIPGSGKLYAIIYQKQKGGPPVQKYVFDLKAMPDGGFRIFYSENKRQKRVETQAAKEQQKTGPQGYFTSMVKMKRKRKPVNPLARQKSEASPPEENQE
jgi:hypothetical protein